MKNKILVLIAALCLTTGSLFGQISSSTPVTFMMLGSDGEWVAASQDSVWADHGLVTGLTGGAGAGIPAFADSAGAVDTAYYWTPYLNRCTLGFGTGKTGQLRTSGLIDASWATAIGKEYWLENAGVPKVTRSTASGIWLVSLGRCVGTGKFLVHPKAPVWSY